jgi:hypothetical protein
VTGPSFHDRAPLTARPDVSTEHTRCIGGPLDGQLVKWTTLRLAVGFGYYLAEPVRVRDTYTFIGFWHDQHPDGNFERYRGEP